MKTVSLQLAQELRKAGFPQESYFAYVSALKRDGDGNSFWILQDEPATESERIEYAYMYKYAAPTAEEILDRLPGEFWKDEIKYRLYIQKIGDLYNIFYEPLPTGVKGAMEMPITASDSLAEVAGKKYLYLAKEGLLSQ